MQSLNTQVLMRGRTNTRPKGRRHARSAILDDRPQRLDQPWPHCSLTTPSSTDQVVGDAPL